MTTISIDDAKNELAALIERARQGEEIVITDGSKPVAKLEPVEAKVSRRGFGMFKGQFHVPDEAFFDPLPEDELKLWTGEAEDKFG